MEHDDRQTVLSWGTPTSLGFIRSALLRMRLRTPNEWQSHTHVISSIAVSPNGKFIAHASWDNTVHLWDTVTSTQIGPVLQHDVNVNFIAISPDGSHLVSGGDDTELRIWSLRGLVLCIAPREYAAQKTTKGHALCGRTFIGDTTSRYRFIVSIEQYTQLYDVTGASHASDAHSKGQRKVS
ncbi:WD40 repeat-like protein [Gyrodon lividus]|nr:WD40 repeat-like protein [Gyrodon lividus]